jgi:hypothetical protein
MPKKIINRGRQNSVRRTGAWVDLAGVLAGADHAG